MSFLRSTSFASPWASKACTPYPQPAATELRAQDAAANEPADCPARASDEDIQLAATRPGHVPLSRCSLGREAGAGQLVQSKPERALSHGQPAWASSPAGVRRRARVRRRGAREQRARSRCSPKTRGAAASSRLSGSGLSRSRAGRRAMCRLVHCDCDARLRSLRAACRRDASRPRRDSDGLAGSKSHISNST